MPTQTMPTQTEPAQAHPNPDPILARLDDQLSWYSQKSRAARKAFKRIKFAEIIAAALIPFITGQQWPYVNYIVGGLGVLITVLEGVLHLNHYQENWTGYRNTAEALKHEKFLFLANAGPYASAANPRVALAERVESLLSQENSQWITSLQKSAQTTK
jgi:hypothetical protein